MNKAQGNTYEWKLDYKTVWLMDLFMLCAVQQLLVQYYALRHVAHH